MTSNFPVPGSKLGRNEFIALIASLMAVNALAVDIMLPALPHMAEALNIPGENDRQLVLSVYLMGFGISQLMFGPISDRFGRRAPLLIGLVIYVITAFAAIFSPNFITLLAFRAMQGAGAAGTRVISLSIVRDTHSGRAMAEVMSLVFMVFVAMPVLAPAIGQLLLFAGPWTFTFIFMGIFGALVCTWAFIRLPETLAPENQRPLTIQSITSGFMTVCTNRTSILYAFGSVFMFGALFGFISSSQQVLADLYALGDYFTLAFAGTAGMMAISAFLNSRMVGRFGMRRIAHSAVIVFFSVSAVWFGLSLLGPVPFPLFMVLLCTVMLMFGLANSNMNALAMEPLGKLAGTASSVFGFIQTFGGAVLGMLIGRMYDGTVRPVAFGFAFMGLLALTAILIAERGKLFGVGQEYQKK